MRPRGIELTRCSLNVSLAVTVFAAACETRISVAVPSCYFCTFEGSIGSLHHCDCNYVPGMLRLGEMYDVAGLVAPRSFCAISGREDSIFPIQHATHAFEQLQKVYKEANAPDAWELKRYDIGHFETADMRARIMAFLNKWL